jgi:ABC-2 type transport system ATP-binding protein
LYPQLAVKDISKKFDAFLALTSTSFKVNTGEIVVLSGPNGSGKTTLFSCITGLIRPTSGSVEVAGHDLHKEEIEVRRRLAFVPDVPRFYLELTAWEHLRFIAMANHAAEGFDHRAEALLRKFGLWGAKDLFPHHYSRGMRLKLGITLALIRPFDVLLLDEPTSALDVDGVELLLNELRELRDKGKAILLSTHDPALIGRISGRSMTIHDGVVEAG